MQNRQIKETLFFHVFLISLLFSLPVSGQKKVNSPFARFNLGTLEPAASFRSLGMGGIGTSIRDNSSIYISNPASYSSLDTNSFLFDFGLDYSINAISEGSASFSSDDINFDHLIIGFPLAKGIGLATGILPYSNGYYKMAEVVNEGDPGYDPLTGSYTSLHVGEGGFSNVFLGSGIKLSKNFSAGVNMSLLLGGVKRVYQVNFTDYNSLYHDNSTENLRLTGINFDYGVQYTALLKKNTCINIGASLTSGNNYKTSYEKIAYRYSVYGAMDTLTYVNNNSSKSYLPGTLRLGISAEKKDKFVLGIDYVTTKWSKAKIDGAEGYLGDTESLLFGVEYIPEKYANYNYLRRIEYRLGAHIEDNYLVFDGTQIKEQGLTVGLGLPMGRTYSKTNLFFDFTRKSGFVSNSHYLENYYTFGISLNFYDYWFLKRKYE